MQKAKRKKLAVPKRNKRSNVTLQKLTLHKLNWLEWLTIGLSTWFLIHPEPYRILLGILLVIPIAGLLINGWHKPSMASLVEIGIDKNGKDKYDVADFIDIAAWVILIRVLFDFEFESFYSMIIPGTLSCIIIMVILFLTHRLIEHSNRDRLWIYTSLFFNVALYSYAGTYAANCAFDDSSPRVFQTEVLDKRISKGRRSTTYYVEVAPWGHHYDKEEISVPHVQYEELEIGNKINIDLKQGLFKIPWYYIERKRKADATF